jgi:iron-sulfur cluster assembly protein CyaY
MTENEYSNLADKAMSAIESALETRCGNIDFEMPGTGMLEIIFDDGSKIIVNKQSAAQEIWVAARSGGYHFRWQNNAWRDTRTGQGLMAMLAVLVREQSQGECDLASSIAT